MPNSIFGTKPNQVPRNADLGPLAYQRVEDLQLGLKLLASVTPTVAATVDFLTLFSSSYDNYLITIDGIRPSALDLISVRMANAGSVDAGSNYITFAIDGASSSNTFDTKFGPTLQTDPAFASISGELKVMNVNEAAPVKYLSIHGVTATSTPTYLTVAKGGIYKGGVVTGFRLYWQNGANFTAVGKIRVYGYSNS